MATSSGNDAGAALESIHQQNQSANDETQEEEGTATHQPSALKCHIKTCTENVDTPLLSCANTKCSRFLHQSCFRDCVLSKHLNALTGFEDGCKVVCTKTCFTKHESQQRGEAKKKLAAEKKASVPEPAKIAWNKDGKNGSDDPNHSEKLLVAWMQDGNNWANFRGGNQQGKTKKQYCKEIAKIINDSGVRQVRSPKDVENKINTIQNQFKIAFDWSQNTGAGLKADDDFVGFEDGCKKRCKYWDELIEVMGSRAASRPGFSTDDMDQASVDYDNNNESGEEGDNDMSTFSNGSSNLSSSDEDEVVVTKTKKSAARRKSSSTLCSNNSAKCAVISTKKSTQHNESVLTSDSDDACEVIGTKKAKSLPHINGMTSDSMDEEIGKLEKSDYKKSYETVDASSSEDEAEPKKVSASSTFNINDSDCDSKTKTPRRQKKSKQRCHKEKRTSAGGKENGNKSSTNKKRPSSTPLALKTAKKKKGGRKGKKGDADSDMIDALLGKDTKKLLQKSAEQRKSAQREQHRHNKAMEAAAKNPLQRIELMQKWDEIKDESWVNEETIKLAFPPDMAEYFIQKYKESCCE